MNSPKKNLNTDSSAAPDDLQLYKKRAESVDLIWCKQVCEIIKTTNLDNKLITLADIGACYFQLYKQLKKTGMHTNIQYNAYDIDDNFLNIGKNYYPEVSQNAYKFDIATDLLPWHDVTVASAIIHHLEKPYGAINKILTSSKSLAIFRIWLGKEDIHFIDESSSLSHPIYAHQLSYDKTIDSILDQGWTPTIAYDEATNNSKRIKIHNSYERRFYIVTCKK